MRDRWPIALGGAVVVAGVLLGWMLLNHLAQDFHHATEPTEQASARQTPSDDTREADVVGVVKAVDVDHRSITLAIATEKGKEQERTYHLANDAEVLLEGPATLDQVSAETRVGLIFATGGKEVIALRSEPFCITAEPKQQQVEVGKPFDLVLRVTNASPTSQSFWVMGTTWDWHWRSSNPRIVWNPSYGYGNWPGLVKLAPGEFYERTRATRVTATGRLSFKMGFTPLVEPSKSPIDGGPNLLPSKRMYWSRDVVLEVTQESEKR